MTDSCPLHPDQPRGDCRDCELDVAVSEPNLVKPIDPETGRRLRHVPLRALKEKFDAERAQREASDEGA